MFTFTEPEQFVECDECAAWSCLVDDIGFKGAGCKGDANVCDKKILRDYRFCRKPFDNSGRCAIDKIDMVCFLFYVCLLLIYLDLL